MQPFSIRHGKALVEQHIRVTMKDRLRQRLWQTVQKYNESYRYQPDPSDNWCSQTSVTEQTEIKLRRLLGFSELKSRAAEDAVGLEGYFMKGYPSCALEVIEQFTEELSTLGEHGYGKIRAANFQVEVNEAMMDFECPWRLSGWTVLSDRR